MSQDCHKAVHMQQQSRPRGGCAGGQAEAAPQTVSCYKALHTQQQGRLYVRMCRWVSRWCSSPRSGERQSRRVAAGRVLLTNACTVVCSTGTPETVQDGSSCCVPCSASLHAFPILVHANHYVCVVPNPAHLVFVWVAALPEPQAQELLVNALGLLAGCMPLLIAVGQPVPECHRDTYVQCAVCQIQMVIWAEHGCHAKVAATHVDLVGCQDCALGYCKAGWADQVTSQQLLLPT